MSTSTTSRDTIWWEKYIPKDQLIHLVAGGVAGGVSRTCVSPLERVKMLLQVMLSVENMLACVFIKTRNSTVFFPDSSFRGKIYQCNTDFGENWKRRRTVWLFQGNCKIDTLFDLFSSGARSPHPHPPHDSLSTPY